MSTGFQNPLLSLSDEGADDGQFVLTVVVPQIVMLSTRVVVVPPLELLLDPPLLELVVTAAVPPEPPPQAARVDTQAISAVESNIFFILASRFD
jgi:hypothetical protein